MGFGSHRLRHCLTDIRVVDTDARSYHARTPHDVLSTAKGEKKHKYLQACQDRRAMFIIIIIINCFLVQKPMAWEQPLLSAN